MVHSANPGNTDSNAIGLENLANRIGSISGFKDPAIQQALTKGLRDQVQAGVQQTEQAAGLTGASQVGATLSQQLDALGQGAVAAHARRVENERSLLQIQAQLVAQAGGLKEQRFEANLRNEQFFAQLRQEKDLFNQGIGPQILGGALAAFAGGGGLAALLDTGKVAADSTAPSPGARTSDGVFKLEDLLFFNK